MEQKSQARLQWIEVPREEKSCPGSLMQILMLVHFMPRIPFEVDFASEDNNKRFVCAIIKRAYKDAATKEKTCFSS